MGQSESTHKRQGSGRGRLPVQVYEKGIAGLSRGPANNNNPNVSGVSSRKLGPSLSVPHSSSKHNASPSLFRRSPSQRAQLVVTPKLDRVRRVTHTATVAECDANVAWLTTVNNCESENAKDSKPVRATVLNEAVNPYPEWVPVETDKRETSSSEEWPTWAKRQGWIDSASFSDDSASNNSSGKVFRLSSTTWLFRRSPKRFAFQTSTGDPEGEQECGRTKCSLAQRKVEAETQTDGDVQLPHVPIAVSDVAPAVQIVPESPRIGHRSGRSSGYASASGSPLTGRVSVRTAPLPDPAHLEKFFSETWQSFHPFSAAEVPERKYSSLSVKVRDGNEEESLAPFADCRQENEDNSVSTIDRTLRVEETQGAQVDDESPESFGKTAITSNEQEEPAEETSAEERILELYNRLHPEAELEMSQGGSSFHGFVRIQMNLVRPISVAAGARPPSLYDLLGSTGLTLDPNVPRVSFFLPRDTVRSIHVSSETTSRELIAALLRKFLVVDDPRKFALYEKCWEVGQTTKAHLRRLADDEKPLRLCLMWSTNQKAGSQQSQRFLVLQENEIGDIPWEHFELPELNNFLRMLDREEEMYKMQLREKYRFLAYRLQELMQSKRPAGS